MKKFAVSIVMAMFLCTLLSGCMFIDYFNGSSSYRETIDLYIKAEVQPMQDEESVLLERSDAVQAGQDTADLLRSKVSWVVVDSNRNGCTVDFTSPDMSKIIREAYTQFNEENKNVSLSEYDALVQEVSRNIGRLIAADDCPMVTTRTKVAFEDGEPVMDRAFYEAMYGGLLSTVESLEEAYGGAQ